MQPLHLLLAPHGCLTVEPQTWIPRRGWGARIRRSALEVKCRQVPDFWAFGEHHSHGWKLLDFDGPRPQVGVILEHLLQRNQLPANVQQRPDEEVCVAWGLPCSGDGWVRPDGLT